MSDIIVVEMYLTLFNYREGQPISKKGQKKQLKQAKKDERKAEVAARLVSRGAGLGSVREIGEELVLDSSSLLFFLLSKLKQLLVMKRLVLFRFQM